MIGFNEFRSIGEAKVDTGSAEAKASARNKRNTPAGKDSKFDTSVFITRKPGESLDSARTRKRRDAHAAKRGVSEAKVDTGDDVKKETDRNKRRFGRDAAPRGSGGVEYAQTLVRRREHRAKRGGSHNKSSSQGQRMGGKGTIYANEEVGISSAAAMDKAKKEALLRKKEQDAVEKEKKSLKKEEVELSEQWVDAAVDISTDYFYKEGLNEDGLDLVIEEVGLDDFVEFVLDPIEELNEERSAKKAAASAPSYEKVKAKVDAGDAARKKSGKGEYAKTAAAKRNYGDEDNTNYDDKPAAKKKTKVVVKKVTPTKKAATKKKVVASVAKAKAKQPLKPTSKKGIGGRIRSAIKKGAERHQKAVGNAKAAYSTQRAKGKVPEKRAKEFAKGVKSGVKTAVKFAKDVKKVVGEEYETQKRKEVLSALKRDKRPLDKKTKEKIASDIVKKKGDTSKSDDRYAYEEVVVELNRYGKETGKATGSLNKRAGTPVNKGGTSSQVMRNVRTNIRKETGKPEGQQKKVKGAKPDTNSYGQPETPVQKIKKYLEKKRKAEADPSQGRYPPGSIKD